MQSIIQAELERLFDVGQVQSLALSHFGLRLAAVQGKAALASALVKHCASNEALEALCDAIILLRPGADSRLDQLRRRVTTLPEPVVVGGALGRYRLERELGRGLLGSVFAATDGAARVRLKLLSASIRDRPAVERYFARTRAMASLAATGARLIELGELGGRLTVVHDLVEGQSFAELLSGAKGQRLRLVAPPLQALLTALDAVHSAGLVHGNVRAENVLLTEAREVVLLDAGADFLRHPLELPAPEQICGEPPTPRSDVYAFGRLLYWFLTGRPPFPGTRAEAAEGCLARSPDPPSFAAPRGSVEPELDEFVLDLLDRDPQRRPADAEAVWDRFESLWARHGRRNSHFPEQELQVQVARLLVQPEDDEVAAALEASVEQGADPSRVARVYLAVSERLPQASPARHGLVRRAAALFDTAGNVQEAEQSYRALLANDPRDEAAWAALERLARRAGDYEKLVELSLEHAEQLESPEQRARLLAGIGDVFKTKLDDVAQARLAYTRAFCEAPQAGYAAIVETLAGGDRAAWNDVLTTLTEALQEDLAAEKRNALLAQLGEWYLAHAARPDLALPCFEAILESEPENERALMQAATLLERRLEQPARAAALYERLVARDPACLPAHEALARIYADLDPHAYARSLARWSDVSTGQQRLELTMRRALLHEKLEERDTARSLYQAVIDEQPHNKEALRSLDRLYSQGTRPVELRRVLSRQIESAETPHQKVQLLARLATLLADEFLENDAAAGALEELLSLDASNVAALKQLCQLYLKLGYGDRIGDSYERLLAVLPPGPERVSAMLEYARVFEERLQQPEAALARYEAVLALDPRSAPALTAVARLYAASGASDHAVEALDTLATLETTAETRAAALSHAAQLLESMGKLAEAIDRHWRAYDLLPASAELGARLKAACLANGDVDFVIDLLENDIQRASDPALRSRLGLELGALLLRHKDDTGRAQAAAELALAARADDAAARVLLGDIETRRKDPRQAAAHYAIAVKRLDVLSRAEAARVLSAYAQALLEIGDVAAGLERLDEVLRRFADDLPAMLSANELLFHHAPKERVITCCRDILQRFAATLMGPAKSLVLYRLGESLRLTNQLIEAATVLERAAQGDPEATAPLVALRAVFAAQARWGDVGRTLQRQLERTPPQEQAELFVEIGDLSANQLKEPATAAGSYARALRLRPNDPKILLKLLQLYTAERDFARVLEAILELAAATPPGPDRAKHLLVAARVALSELADRTQALALIEQALALAPGSDAVLREAMALRRQAGDSAGARRLLEQRVEAAAGAADRELALKLAAELADEYLADLQGPEAIAVYEAVVRLSAEDPAREEILAELYESEPARYLEPALRLVERAIARDPRRPEPYRRLLRTYRAVRNPDGAFCACQALVALGQADAREQRYFQQLRSSGEARAQAELSPDDWQELVLHPSVDPELTAIFALLEPVIRRQRGASLERAGYANAERLGADDGATAHAILFSAALIGARAPLIVADPALSRGVKMVASRKPCLALSELSRRADVPLTQAGFVAGKNVCYLKPGFYSRVIVPRVPALKSWLLAAIRLLSPRLSLPPEIEGLTLEAQRVLGEHLAADARERLVEPIAALAQRETPLDVGAWAEGVDWTADRVGLVISGDLPTALAVIRATSEAAASALLPEREAQLLAYSVSPAYLALRAKYGLDVDVSAVARIASVPPPA